MGADHIDTAAASTMHGHLCIVSNWDIVQTEPRVIVLVSWVAAVHKLPTPASAQLCRKCGVSALPIEHILADANVLGVAATKRGVEPCSSALGKVRGTCCLTAGITLAHILHMSSPDLLQKVIKDVARK